MGKSKFHTAQKRQSEKEMAKHRKQFVPLSGKASSGLYYFFSIIHRLDFTSFFSRSLVRKFLVWAMVIYKTIIHIRLWMEMYPSRSSPIFYTLPMPIFRACYHPYTYAYTLYIYRHFSHSLADSCVCLCEGCIFVFILSVRCAIHSVIQIVMWCVHTFCLSHKSTESHLNDLGNRKRCHECAEYVQKEYPVRNNLCYISSIPTRLWLRQYTLSVCATEQAWKYMRKKTTEWNQKVKKKRIKKDLIMHLN